MAHIASSTPAGVVATLCLFSVCLLSAAPGAQSAEPAQGAGNAIRGAQLFHAHGCYGCHGYNGETGARDLVGTGSPLVADEALFRLFLRLRSDQAPALPSTQMPNFPAQVLNDTDVRDLFAFIRSFRANAPQVEDVPTLRRILEIAVKPAGTAPR